MTRPRPPSLAALCLIYAGILLGFSFIATPAKFLTPGLSMSDLLLVGRTSFSVFAWVEAGLVVALAALAIHRHERLAFVGLLAAIVAGQHLLLRPILDASITAIVDGAPPAPSGLHHIYALLELAKLCALLWVGRTHAPALAQPAA